MRKYSRGERGGHFRTGIKVLLRFLVLERCKLVKMRKFMLLALLGVCLDGAAAGRLQYRCAIKS